MPCKVDVDAAVKSDILECGREARLQIGNFLLGLQDNPLPENRREMKSGAFYALLPCGYYVAWEVFGDLMKLALSGSTKGISVRILGVGRERPA
jgi:hypothetical protein